MRLSYGITATPCSADIRFYRANREKTTKIYLLHCGCHLLGLGRQFLGNRRDINSLLWVMNFQRHPVMVALGISTVQDYRFRRDISRTTSVIVAKKKKKKKKNDFRNFGKSLGASISVFVCVCVCVCVYLYVCMKVSR